VLECIEPEDEATLHYASIFLGNYALDIPATELLELFVPRLEATHYLGDAFPRFWPNFGPGIVAAFAGADLHAVKDTTWFSPVDRGVLSSLQIRLRDDNPWWQRVKTVTQVAVDLRQAHDALGDDKSQYSAAHQLGRNGTRQLNSLSPYYSIMSSNIGVIRLTNGTNIPR
jgi:hypothetical protein